MYKQVSLYRKRFIPDEINYLKDDVIVYMDEHIIITKWDTLKPRKDIKRGMSVYFLDKGYKVSKLYSPDDEVVYWYCDIVKTIVDEEKKEYIFEDLLLDVVIYEDDRVEILDADELADAVDNGMIPLDYISMALRQMHDLLNIIYSGEFDQIKKLVAKYE
jgi:predicted RNA-binding protein associated with RNAse of E/G family